MATRARPAKKVFDILASMESIIWDEIGECNAPYKSQESIVHNKRFFTKAIEKMNESTLEPKDITPKLLDMLENENYHRMYAVCEIWTNRSTIDKEVNRFA